jgi:male-specific lethal 2
MIFFLFTQVRHPKQKPKRKGCRCGNATATPGKLTCCGQRCPCYVEAKSCTDCRCRGCRNPHTPGGKKLRPFGAGQEQGEQCGSSVGESSNTSVNSVTTVDLNLPSYVHIHGTSSTSLYSSSPLSVEQVPTTLMVDDEKSNSEDSDIDVDV